MGKLGQGTGTTERGHTPLVGDVCPRGAGALDLGSTGRGAAACPGSGDAARVACPWSCLNLCPFSLNPTWFVLCTHEQRGLTAVFVTLPVQYPRL